MNCSRTISNKGYESLVQYEELLVPKTLDLEKAKKSSLKGRHWISYICVAIILLTRIRMTLSMVLIIHWCITNCLVHYTDTALLRCHLFLRCSGKYSLVKKIPDSGWLFTSISPYYRNKYVPCITNLITIVISLLTICNL